MTGHGANRAIVAVVGGAALLALAGACSAAQPESTPTVAASPTPQRVDLAFMPNPTVPPAITRAQPELVNIDLEIQELEARLDEGVGFEYWTFGGTVPGTFLRVRQGDTVELTLRNPATNRIEHDIDLHAVTGPGGGAALTRVAPGEEKTFRFKALNPGLYVYHCATPIIPVHVMSGMYGLILVEPEGGLPEVDHEFYVMQGEIYARAARGTPGMQTTDLQKLLSEQPEYVVFNGAVGSLTGDRALKANVGDRVRVYFGVGGPNITSSFHVIGEIFDTVYPEGALEDPQSNIQTTLVPAGGSTAVEFTVEVPGNYVLVDHSLGRTMKGAVAILTVEGPENPEVYAPVE